MNEQRTLPEYDRDLCAVVAREFETEQLSWFRELVELPSHTYAREDVEQAASWVDDLAEDLGLQREVRSDPEQRFADHRIYRTRSTTSSDRTMALVGHVDTVFPRQMGFLRFERDDDVVRGPGVLDMKSGLSAILFGLRALRQHDPEAFAALKLRFVCNSDEEVGSPSSSGLFAEIAPKLTKALVFEGGRDEDRIITRRKGGGAFTLTVHGRAAHAGNEHATGINAIVALSLVVPEIEAITDYERGITVNVGLIEGGTAKNTVPDRASCVIDTRFSTVADSKAVVQHLERLADAPLAGRTDIPERLVEARFRLSGRVTRPPMEVTDASQALRQAYEACAAPVGLGTGEAPLQGGGSDANLLAAAGVPSIDGLGPFGKHFHNPREWSSLASLQRRTQALACFLAREAKQGPHT